MRLSRLFRSRRSRRYPIKRDEKGHSLRARCFILFGEGQQPLEVMGLLQMKKDTVYRYYRDWLRRGPNFDNGYAYYKRLFKKTNPEREENLKLFADPLGISKEEFEAVLSRPHGLYRLLTGKLYFPGHAEVDHKMHIAVRLALLISDHLVKKDGRYADVYFALEHSFKRYQMEREDDEADIAEHNKFMTFVRRIVQADLENEAKNRINPLILTPQERNTINKLMINSEIKNIKMWYWSQILNLQAEGYTEEGARDKIYQDLGARGNEKAATLMRKLQDIIHPLKNNPLSPTSPTPSPPT